MSNIEIAQHANKKYIVDLTQKRFEISSKYLEPYSHYKAKLSMEYIQSLKGEAEGKLILIMAASPTPAGKGKTTTTVSLGDTMNRIGKNTLICLREPLL